MFKIYFCSILLLCLSTLKSQSWDWVITENHDLTDKGKNIGVDKDKNIYVTGITTSGSNSNFIMKDFLWKFDANGTVLWKQELDNTLTHSKMICDSLGTTYITAGQVLAKFDHSGQKLWQITRSEDNAQFSGICKHPSGGVILFGGRATDDLSTRGVVSRYDENGICLWTKYTSRIGTAITCDHLGNAYVAGVMTPEPSSINSGFISVYAPDGLILRTTTVPQTPTSIIVDQQNNIYLAGSYNRMEPIEINNQIYTMQGEALNYFIIKYDPNYSIVWHKILTGSIWGGWLRTDKQSNCYFTISANQSLSINGELLMAGKLGFLLMKINPVGQIIYSSFSHSGMNINGGGTADAWDFCLDNEDNIYFTGSTTGNHFFGPHEIHSNNGYSDLFVAKLSQKNSIQVGLQDIRTSNNLRISPNPSSGTFKIFYSNTNNTQFRINIMNSQGQRVFSDNYDVQGDLNKDIDINAHPAGIYMIELSSPEIRLTQKIVLY